MDFSGRMSMSFSMEDPLFSKPYQRQADDDEDQDPFGRGHSKLYKRRKEIEADLRREFNLPEEEVWRDVLFAQGRGKAPLIFARPPPVPKPKLHQRLPKIPRVHSEPPRQRWGHIEDPGDLVDRSSASRAKDQWWQKEQERMREESVIDSLLEGEGSAFHQHRAPPLKPDWMSCLERVGLERPLSYRSPRQPQSQSASELRPPQPSSSFTPQPPPVPPMNGFRPASSSTAYVSTGRHNSEKIPHAEMAKELEEIAREHRQRREAREEEETRRAAERASLAEKERKAEEAERERRRRISEELLQEAHRREQIRFEEMRQMEEEKRQRDAEEAERRQQEQDEWEREIRKRFAEEKRQQKERLQQEMTEEAEKQTHFQNRSEQDQSDRREQRNREQESERAKYRQRLEKEAERHRAAAAAEAAAQLEAEKRRAASAAEEADRMKRNMEPPPSFSRPSPSSGRARRFFKPETPDSFTNAAGEAYRERFGGAASSQQRSSSVPGSRAESPRRPPSAAPKKPPSTAASVSSSGDEALKQAELAAMRALKDLQKLPNKEDRQRAFKDLLRLWHPDKNPQSVEVATAVFQRLQSERSKVL